MTKHETSAKELLKSPSILHFLIIRALALFSHLQLVLRDGIVSTVKNLHESKPFVTILRSCQDMFAQNMFAHSQA